MSGGNTATLCSFFLAAALHVRLPDFIAVEQDFIAIRDGVTGALAGAFIALVTNILQAEIHIFVRGQGLSVVTMESLKRGPRNGLKKVLAWGYTQYLEDE